MQAITGRSLMRPRVDEKAEGSDDDKARRRKLEDISKLTFP